MSELPSAVSMRGIVKRFPGVLANDHVDFELRPGEIHALLGENGAGKSTLMHILAGLYQPDAGTIMLRGQPLRFSSPRHAIQAGIGMIHQHFMLVPSQTVTENILLGLQRPRLRLQLSRYDQEIAELSARFGLHVDPQARIWQLSVGEQQRVEILKMLYRGVEILILDEPTAVLAPQEVDSLCETLREMAAQGKSIIFISHKLQEVLRVADRITVLRRGRVTAAGLPAGQTSRAELARLMVGREVFLQLEKPPASSGAEVLLVEDLHASNDQGLPALRGVSLEVRAGEIVGLAGVAGNGQRELGEILSGMRRVSGGRVLVKGRPIQNQPARVAIRHGVASIPEDRTHVGSAPNLSIVENLIMKQYGQPPLSRGWLLDAAAAERFAGQLVQSYDIRVPSLQTPARLLSGGNLQRLILARELATQPALLVAMQPTHGLDVGAIERVHRLFLEQRQAGTAILLISEELEELLALSDRIYVIYEGRIMGQASPNELERIGLLMTGTVAP